MNLENLRASLAEASGQVLEEAAFIFTEKVEEDDASLEWGTDVIRASLGFSGPDEGRFSIAASKALCALIAGELLGVEPDDPEVGRRAEDVLGEVLNMTAGMVLSMVYAEAQTWELGVPEVRPLSRSQQRQEDGAADLKILLVTEEEEPIQVSAFLGGAKS